MAGGVPSSGPSRSAPGNTTAITSGVSRSRSLPFSATAGVADGERDEYRQRQRERLAQQQGRPQAHSLRRPSGMMAASKFAPSIWASVRIAFFRLAPSKLAPRRSAP